MRSPERTRKEKKMTKKENSGRRRKENFMREGK